MGEEKGRNTDREEEIQRVGEVQRSRKSGRDELHALSLLSDGVGVKRLISLKPVGLPGTSR